MTQKQKELLLKDLCARLPYGVKVQTVDGDIEFLIGLDMPNYYSTNTTFYTFDDYPIKPYLLPITSMTEEQYYEMQNISCEDCLEHMEVEKEWRNNSPFNHLPLYQHKVIEFFHKHHFDYRGLIPMGLAIDATGLNIY